jgi:hypothetical protein
MAPNTQPKMEQQKLMLPAQTRKTLALKADEFDMTMSEIAEHLIDNGCYPEAEET